MGIIDDWYDEYSIGSGGGERLTVFLDGERIDSLFAGIYAIDLDGEMFEPDAEGFYMTDAITDYAVKFLDNDDDKTQPFFLYVSYTAPHVPLQAWPEDIARYRGKYMKGWDRLREERYERMIDLGIIDRNWKLTPRDANAWSWEEEDSRSASCFTSRTLAWFR